MLKPLYDTTESKHNTIQTRCIMYECLARASYNSLLIIPFQQAAAKQQQVVRCGWRQTLKPTQTCMDCQVANQAKKRLIRRERILICSVDGGKVTKVRFSACTSLYT